MKTMLLEGAAAMDSKSSFSNEKETLRAKFRTFSKFQIDENLTQN